MCVCLSVRLQLFREVTASCRFSEVNANCLLSNFEKANGPNGLVSAGCELDLSFRTLFVTGPAKISVDFRSELGSNGFQTCAGKPSPAAGTCPRPQWSPNFPALSVTSWIHPAVGSRSAVCGPAPSRNFTLSFTCSVWPKLTLVKVTMRTSPPTLSPPPRARGILTHPRLLRGLWLVMSDGGAGRCCPPPPVNRVQLGSKVGLGLV